MRHLNQMLQDQDEKEEIDMTPMLDVVFILLIFFIVLILSTTLFGKFFFLYRIISVKYLLFFKKFNFKSLFCK